jgi:cysteinyl-tRNA synthetase
VRTLRQRMAEWVPAAEVASEGARELDRRFRAAVADDLNMPQTLVVLNEAVKADVAGGEKYTLLASWDQVLGLDLERAARDGFEPTPQMLDLVRERDAARAAKDYGKSDELRDRLAELGLEVMDTPTGTTIRPRG